MIKKITIILLVIITLSCIATQMKVHASATLSLEKVAGDAQSFIDAGDDDKLSGDAIKTLSDGVYNTLVIIGAVIAVVVGVILGVKIVISGAQERAQYKELLVPYFIGIVVLFGAFGIWKIVVTILQS